MNANKKIESFKYDPNYTEKYVYQAKIVLYVMFWLNLYYKVFIMMISANIDYFNIFKMLTILLPAYLCVYIFIILSEYIVARLCPVVQLGAHFDY